MMNELTIDDKSKTLAAVLIRGDLAQLSDTEKLSHLKAVCESLGLNPLTNPFRYITMNGKVVLYAGRDATDQLRKIHNVSLEITRREMHGDCFVVTARAKMQNGRCDESVGAVYLGKLNGEALANAYMKAETKAKRRVTLSICGLGMLDETEVETISTEPQPSPKPTLEQGAAFFLKKDFAKPIETPPQRAKIRETSPHEIAGRAIDSIQKLREKVYLIADQESLTGDLMKKIITERYKKESSTDLNSSELEDLIKFLEK